MKRALLSSLCGAALIGGIEAPAVMAQDQGEEFYLEEIIVNARRKDEGLQDVPVSVQVFDASAMEEAGIRDLYEVTNRIPGAKFNIANATDPEIFMRGIGSNIQGAAADSSVGIFIDGVYMARSSGVLVDLFDLERVEVLKGPQSLRFGKNIVGGLIHYITKKPGDETEGKVEASYGNYNAVNIAASIRGPVSDTVSAGLTATSRTRDGFATNTMGGDEEDINVQSVRGSLRFRPSDKLDATITADYTRHRDGARWVDVDVAGDSHAVTYNSFFAPPIPGLPDSFVLPTRNAPFKSSDPRKGARNFSGYQNSDLYGIAANVDYDISDSMTLNSITSFRKSDIEVREDGCGMYWNVPIDSETQVPVIDAVMAAGIDAYLNTVPDCWFDQQKADDVKQFSQELRLSGGGERLQWSLGAYVLKEDIERLERVSFYFPDFDGITEFAFAIAYGGEPATPAGGTSNARTGSKATNLGLFGEVTYDITESLSINGGVRYAYDKKKFTSNRFGDSFDSPLPPGGFTVTDKDSWDAWLPSLTLSYAPTEGQNYFARVERGYKAGGYTGENAGNPLDAIVSFAPEFATSYEAGGKFLLADRRLMVNAVAYFTKYKDLQTQQFLQLDPTRPPDNFVVNAANGAEAYGLELDFKALLGAGFAITGNYAYSRCEFTGTLIIDEDGTDVDGNTCRRTPRHAANLGASYEVDLADNLVGSLGADYQWTDEYYFENTNTADLKNPSEFTLNLYAGVAAKDDRWRLSAWVKNVTDELNYASRLELFGTYYANYQAPRTYGVTFTWRFGQ
ncbi:TonB-dependent receptor [Pseudokordiimonas caeni]|uniref:TonB-dependent receptor n=1 Tax=Pseudokordiimonas caeni TaxID=2997908 RepID=UPI0028122FB9|nr:TonB-dependent receptor [Pseudokordiimonas caeni]